MYTDIDFDFHSHAENGIVLSIPQELIMDSSILT